MKYILRVEGFKTDVFLGCFPKEQERKRPVIFNISIFFKNDLSAWSSDDYSDVICYDKLTAELNNQLECKRFNLVESLAMFAYKCIKKLVGDNAEICVETIKPSPNSSISEARFVISDQ